MSSDEPKRAESLSDDSSFGTGMTPFPSPEALREYEAIVPGAAEKILDAVANEKKRDAQRELYEDAMHRMMFHEDSLMSHRLSDWMRQRLQEAGRRELGAESDS